MCTCVKYPYLYESISTSLPYQKPAYFSPIELRMDEILTQNLIYRLLSYKNPIKFYVSENIALFCYNVTCNNL